MDGTSKETFYFVCIYREKFPYPYTFFLLSFQSMHCIFMYDSLMVPLEFQSIAYLRIARKDSICRNSHRKIHRNIFIYFIFDKDDGRKLLNVLKDTKSYKQKRKKNIFSIFQASFYERFFT